jgi:hypothetical protein
VSLALQILRRLPISRCVTNLVESLAHTMDSGPGFPWFIAWFALCVLTVTVIHEGGHLLAALWTNQAEIAMNLGSHGELLERRLGEVRLRLRAVGAPWRVAGSVTFDGAQTTARAMALIALAGPAGSLLGAAVTGWLASALTSSALSDFLAMTTVMGLCAGLGNLIPLTVYEGTRRKPGRRVDTDGKHALNALRVLRDLHSI